MGVGVAVDIKGQQSGLLTAIKPSHSEPRQGVMWDCKCSGPKCNGKGRRKVLAKDFKQKKIKRCLKCADPARRASQAANSSLRWNKKVTGPMYPEQFRKSYRDHIAGFTAEQRMLFDVIMDGRTNYQYQVQAADLVLRAANISDELELLIVDNPKRWQRYLERQKFNQQRNPVELRQAA